MAEKGTDKRLAGIRKKLEAADDVIYVVGTDLFRDSAVKDMKYLVREVEAGRREISELKESLRAVYGKLKEELRQP